MILGRDLPENTKRELENGVGLLLLSTIEKTSNIAAERNSSNGVTSDELPPVFLGDLIKIPHRQFNEVVLKQSQRPSVSASPGVSALILS